MCAQDPTSWMKWIQLFRLLKVRVFICSFTCVTDEGILFSMVLN